MSDSLTETFPHINSGPLKSKWQESSTFAGVPMGVCAQGVGSSRGARRSSDRCSPDICQRRRRKECAGGAADTAELQDSSVVTGESLSRGPVIEDGTSSDRPCPGACHALSWSGRSPVDTQPWHGLCGRSENAAAGGGCQLCSLPRALLEGTSVIPQSLCVLPKATSAHV